MAANIPKDGFKNGDQLQEWLEEQPRGVAISMAWRAAAQVLPLLAGEDLESMILPVFRAIAPARLAGTWPNHAGEVKVAAYAADATYTANAARAAANAARVAADAAAYAAADAADAAYAARAAADAATYAAAYATADAAAAMWQQISHEVQLIETNGINALKQAPLWFDDVKNPVSAPPDWAKNYWGHMQHVLNAQPAHEAWKIWIDWYDDILHDRPGPTRNAGLELARIIGLPGDIEITDEDWEQGPTIVNPKIAAIIERFAGKDDNFQQVKAAYHFTFKNNEFWAEPQSGETSEPQFAADTLAELLDKARDYQNQCQNFGNCPPKVLHTAEKLADVLQNWQHTPAPGKLLQRLRSLEADITAFDTPEGRKELSSSFIAYMVDLQASIHDLIALYPVVQEMLANMLALRLQDSDLNAINGHIDEVAKIAGQSELVNQSAIDAINDGKDEIADASHIVDTSNNDTKRASAIKEHSEKTASRVLSVRNFGSELLRRMKKGALDGAQEGVKKTVSGTIVTGATFLTSTLAGPWAGLATFISSIAPLARKAEEVAKQTNEDDDDQADI